MISWSEANALTKRSNSLPAAHQVTLPSLCLFTCKCHLERGRAYNFEVLDSIQKVYFSLVFPPSSLLFFPLLLQTRQTDFRPALRVCTCAELILPLNLLGRKKKRGLSFILSTEAKRKKGRKHIHTQRKKEKEKVETVESVTRANRITLYFPPDEGGGI